MPYWILCSNNTKLDIEKGQNGWCLFIIYEVSVTLLWHSSQSQACDNAHARHLYLSIPEPTFRHKSNRAKTMPYWIFLSWKCWSLWHRYMDVVADHWVLHGIFSLPEYETTKGSKFLQEYGLQILGGVKFESRNTVLGRNTYSWNG